MAKILIVDDSAFSRLCIKQLLIDKGHEVIGEAKNAKEGFESYQNLNPDLITVDLVMPKTDGMDGMGLIGKIIQHDSEAKIIAVTAMAQKPMLEEVLRTGAASYVLKPVSSEILERKVNEALSAY